MTTSDNPAKRSRRVMVVEDHPAIGESMVMTLRHLGHDARLADTGGEALSLAETFRPDLVLLDIGLPDMSGLEVAVELRRNGDHAGTTIVAVTAYGRETVGDELGRWGLDDYVQKPVDWDRLARVLEGGTC